MIKQFACFALTFVFSAFALAESESSNESRAYWDYGAGFGAVSFEHYPASDQSRTVALPFPTFQYRGKILRADDRDGAHVYLLKDEKFKLELSGYGSPALKSAENNARQGMDDLPWLGALGPKLLFRPSEATEFSLNLYQAVTTDFVMTRTAGLIYETRFVYSWTKPMKSFGPFQEDGYTDGKWVFSVRGGSKEYLALYFEVPSKDATLERPAYDAKEGLLNHSLSYFQTFKSGRAALYVGGGVHSYDISANRASPLHRSDRNWTALIGFNYTLGESVRPAVPENETSTIIETLRLRHNRQLRNEI